LNGQDRAHWRAVIEIGLGRQRIEQHAGQAEDVRVRPDACAVLGVLLGRRVADGTEQHVSERHRHAAGLRDTKVRDLEDLRFAEAAAQDVVGSQVSMDDADRVDRRQACRQTAQQVGHTLRLECVTRLLEAVDHPFFERRSFDAAVNVFDGEPGQRRPMLTVEARSARIDEAHHERCGRHALVQATQSDRFLLDHEQRRGPAIRDHLRLHQLDHDGRDTVGRVAQREKRDARSAFTDTTLQAVADVRVNLRGDRDLAQARRLVITIRYLRHPARLQVNTARSGEAGFARATLAAGSPGLQLGAA
jgi:hypothetical protein